MSEPAAAPLRFASYLGDNGLGFYGQVVDYVGQVCGLPATLLASPPELEWAFGDDQLEAAFMCGLPYVRQAAKRPAPVRLLAAPVLAATRYGGQPVYFSDVIVLRSSPHRAFADLRGATFAYNEADSFSGFVLPRYLLHALGETWDYFGATFATGSHAASMDWVESGRVTAAAIDSVVLETELRHRPGRAASFRVVAAIGPAAMPPVVASACLPDETIARLTAALTEMHTNPAGQAILQAGGVRRFAPVRDADYAGIRRILRVLDAAG